jgi:large subunit ribosomal protein L22
MEARAVAKYVRISPRKARQVVDLIRRRSVVEAIDILSFTPKKAALLVKKVLESAVANIQQREKRVSKESLYIKEAFVDGGPTLKRFRARAMGRVGRILKRTSHITIIVDKMGEGK